MTAVGVALGLSIALVPTLPLHKVRRVLVIDGNGMLESSGIKANVPDRSVPCISGTSSATRVAGYMSIR